MVRVVIYEDNVFDVINRYLSIVRENEVYVRLVFQGYTDDRFRNSQVKYLVNEGFIKENVGFELDILSDADIFFVDGLGGNWKEVMSKLPRDKSFLNTNGLNYENQARSEGYSVLEGSIKDKVRELFGE